MHVIDFDDAGFGWHMYELAVALFGAQRPDLRRSSTWRAVLGSDSSGR